MGIFDSIRGIFTRKPTPLTKPAGAPNVAVWGGYVQSQERSAALQGTRKYKTYMDTIANTPMVGTAIRLRLDLLAKPSWTCKPPNDIDTPEAWEWSKRGEQLFADMATPMPQVVQRSGLYADFGFGIQTWHVKRNDEGRYVLADLRPIACENVERWDRDEHGTIKGVEQINPETQERIYIPRERMVYLVDRAINDSPEGMGLLRHVVEYARILKEFQRLEGIGFETDLSGVPKIRAPLNELNQLVEDGVKGAEALRTAIQNELRGFARSHNRGEETSVVLDSEVYVNADGSPSSIYKQDVELLQNSGGNLAALDVAIMRYVKFIAMLYGTEGLLIGMESTGAYALAKDKTTKLHLLIDSLLGTIRAAYQRELLDRLWALNGWPMEFKPELKVEPVNRADVVQVMAVLEGLARSGVMLRTDDPAIDEARGLVDLPPQPPPDPIVEGLLSQLTRPDADGTASGEIDTEEAA